MALWILKILLNVPLLILAQLGNLFFCTNLRKINIDGCEMLKLIPTHPFCFLVCQMIAPKIKMGLSGFHRIFYNISCIGKNCSLLGKSKW